MTGKILSIGVGRPRKPSALKDLAGTSRADRANPAEPALPAAAMPKPPRDLKADEKRAWRELAALVDPMRIATASDLAAFRSMVECAGVLAALRRSFYGDGKGEPTYWAQTKSGSILMMRPEVNAIPTYQKLMLHHFARWGLNPADRSRVSALAEPEAPNPIAKFGLGAKPPGGR